jgi:SAM-dependent methyltransferase
LIYAEEMNVIRSLVLSWHKEVAYVRWFMATRNGKRIPSYGSEHALVAGKTYSRDWFRKYAPIDRILGPMMLLRAIAYVDNDQYGKKLLVIGPRYENELFIAWGLGYKWTQIVGLDLLSYSKRIVVGDMHSSPFPDSEFDHICCGWTISYSLDPVQALHEIDRILRPGGVVVFGVDIAEVDEKPSEKLSDILMGSQRVQTVQQIHKSLPDYTVVANIEGIAHPRKLVVALRKPAISLYS